MNAEISVVIPMYNSEKYLLQCLDSLKNQTYTNFEVILIDDGSSDNTVSIATEYCAKDLRFKLFKKVHVDGTGAGPARNMGYENAKGKYILFLDSDDFFEHTMLEKLYNKAQSNNSQVLLFNANIYDNVTGQETVYKTYGPLCVTDLPEKDVFSADEISEKIFQTTWGAAWNVFLLKEYIDKNNINFQATRFQDDVFFTYSCLAVADRITILNECLLHYRINLSNNQSATRYKYIEIMYDAPVKLKLDLEKRGLFEKYKISFWDRFLTPMVRFIFMQNNAEDFKIAYNLFRNKLIKELRFDEYLTLPSEKIYRKKPIEDLKIIIERPVEEYLFVYRYNENNYINGYYFPEEVYKKKIIIYGAGDFGKKFYGRSWVDNYAKVVAWVDKNYERLGWPVTSPNAIKNYEFDYILIAITKENIVDDVKKELVMLGVEDNRILCITKK